MLLDILHRFDKAAHDDSTSAKHLWWLTVAAKEWRITEGKGAKKPKQKLEKRVHLLRKEEVQFNLTL